MRRLAVFLGILCLYACETDSVVENQQIEEESCELPPCETESSGETEEEENVTCENIFVGDVALESQQQVEEFAALGYTCIEGDLIIGFSIFDQPSMFSDITDLTSLNTLTQINGKLEINQNSNLVTLNGLEGLTYFNWIQIYWNESLTSIEALSNNENTDLGLLRIFFNESLESITAFSNITKVVSLDLSVSHGLTSIEGIHNITEAKYFHLYQAPLITSIEMLNITSVESDFRIGEFNSLQSLNGLEQLTEWNSNGGISRFTIDFNIALTDFCALENLFSNNPDFDPNDLEIYWNEYNPTLEDIINGDCAL